MKLDAKKLGLAVAIVTAIMWLITRLLLLAAPFGPMRAGGYPPNGHMPDGYMMRGYGYGHGYGHMYALGWGGYFAGLVAGLILLPLIAGVAAWGTAAIYNRLLGGNGTEESSGNPVD